MSYHIGIFIFLWKREGCQQFLNFRGIYLICFLIPFIGTAINTTYLIDELVRIYNEKERVKKIDKLRKEINFRVEDNFSKEEYRILYKKIK